jgi:hypothetical protein
MVNLMLVAARRRRWWPGKRVVKVAIWPSLFTMESDIVYLVANLLLGIFWATPFSSIACASVSQAFAVRSATGLRCSGH